MKISQALVIPQLVIFTLALLISFPVFAKSPVWKISNGDKVLYIGGTIHLLGKNDYPLPIEFEKAYEQSELLVFEVDPAIVKSPKAQQVIARYTQFTDGRRLSQAIHKDTYQRLSQFLASRGLSAASFETVKPGMLSMLLTVIELQRLGLAGAGVDEFYGEKAQADGKQVLSLETLEDQFKALSSMDDNNGDAVILHTLDELGGLSEEMRQLKKAWRQGDNQTLTKVGIEDWQQQFPRVYRALMVDRNQRWLPQLEQLVSTPEVEYVLVGALHLVGSDGLLKMFKDKGYSVEQLQTE